MTAKSAGVPQILLEWLKCEEIHAGTRAGITTIDLQHLQKIERENKNLHQAHDILRTADAFFA